MDITDKLRALRERTNADDDHNTLTTAIITIGNLRRENTEQRACIALWEAENYDRQQG